MGLFREVEGIAGLRAGHQSIGRVEVLAHNSRTLAAFELSHRGLDRFAQSATAIQTSWRDRAGREQIGHFEILLRWIGHERERIVGFAQESTRLTIGQIATAASHRLRQDDMGRQVAARAAYIPYGRANMRCVDPAGEQTPGLHDLPARIMHGRSAMEARTNQRNLIRDFRMAWKNLRQLNTRRRWSISVGTVHALRPVRWASCQRYRAGWGLPS